MQCFDRAAGAVCFCSLALVVHACCWAPGQTFLGRTVGFCSLALPTHGCGWAPRQTFLGPRALELSSDHGSWLLLLLLVSHGSLQQLLLQDGASEPESMLLLKHDCGLDFSSHNKAAVTSESSGDVSSARSDDLLPLSPCASSAVALHVLPDDLAIAL
jgi:hypothetical protein